MPETTQRQTQFCYNCLCTGKDKAVCKLHPEPGLTLTLEQILDGNLDLICINCPDYDD